MSAIGENAVGGLIASEAHGVIGWVVSLIKEEIKLARGLEKELDKLKLQFEKLSSVIEGASHQRGSNSLMDGWLKKIKDAAEDVDDLLDECSYKALQDRIQTRKRDKAKKILKQPFSHWEMAHKVRDMEELTSSIYEDADKLGIKPCQVAAGEVYYNSQDNQETSLQNQRLFVDQSLFLGRKKDMKNLIELICAPINSNSDLTVIGIVGMAGLGKTTLSKCICNEQEVTEFFDPVISLVISSTFNLESILKNMLEKLNKDRPNLEDKQLLTSEIAKKLKNQRYLLILDDVWDTIDWKSLGNILNDIGGSHGSVILVTSREKNAVDKMEFQSCYGSKCKRPTIYPLKGLSEDDSWELFIARLSDENLIDTNEKELIAKSLVRKCEGVPLAIRALGDLLRIKSTIKDWKKIKESDLWRQAENDILPSLRLSYDYLPSIALKKCFAYCAIFEEDEVIEKHDLIYMWMAQGFLYHLKPDQEMEDKGEEYIEWLLNSSLFQEASMDDNDNVMTFKIHDLVLSLARVVSMGECLCSNKDERLDEVRHLSISYYSECKELTITSFTKLKTCMLHKMFERPSLHFLLMCRRLRVFDMGCNSREDLDWKPLGSLKHLRYFGTNVHDNRSFKPLNLPTQITKLYHLQTLRLYHWQGHWQHESVSPFPKKIGNLINLRHIVTSDVSIGIPVGLGHLTALQTLPIIELGLNWGGRLSDVGLLTNLRGKLEIHCLTSLTDVEEAHSLNLGSKSNLDSLVLEWGRGEKNPKANEILEALQPNSNLHKLELHDFNGTTFPRWLMGPGFPVNNIVSLQIVFSEADGNLKLENFICLRILRVESCCKLTITLPSNESKCCKYLEELHIYGCEKVELPDLLLFPRLWAIAISGIESTRRDNVLVGLGSLPNLRELDTDLQVPAADLEEERPVCKSLTKLTLSGSKYNNNGDTTYLPEQLQYLVALQSLTIKNFESVEAIPNWVGKLTSLQNFTVYGMPKLKHLPPQGVWKSLSNLTSFSCGGSCPLLEKDINNITGEWFKIAHIPHISPEYSLRRRNADKALVEYYRNLVRTREQRQAGESR